MNGVWFFYFEEYMYVQKRPRQCPPDPNNGVDRLMAREPPGGPLFWLLLHMLTTRGANIDNNIITSRGNVTQVKAFYLEYFCWR
jgi:hypothetical protein